MIDRIILGHNQFFGVNHLMAQAGDQKEAYFSDISRILSLLHFCREQEVKALMMSTHERATLISEALQKEAVLKDTGIYLLLPYAAKYVKQANEKGLMNIIADSLSGTSLQEKMSMFFRGGLGLIAKDFEKILTAMIDFELAPFRGLNLRAVFLHDVLTDLALGWGVSQVLELFADHVQEKYGAIPAFCTKNLPRLMRLLEKTSVTNPLIMASINKAGYQVNPSREAFEACLKEKPLQLLAMSTLAAGYLKPREAYEYLFSLPRVDSIVVGLSTREHALETFAEIRRHWARASA
jgi:hypothetical protein